MALRVPVTIGLVPLAVSGRTACTSNPDLGLLQYPRRLNYCWLIQIHIPTCTLALQLLALAFHVLILNTVPMPRSLIQLLAFTSHCSSLIQKSEFAGASTCWHIHSVLFHFQSSFSPHLLLPKKKIKYPLDPLLLLPLDPLKNSPQQGLHNS